MAAGEEVKRLVGLLEKPQKPDERLATATGLIELLDEKRDKFAGEEAIDAFLEAGGPSVVRYRLDSMEGDWMAEARNGTTNILDALARLPGLEATFDRVTQIKDAQVSKAVQTAKDAHSHSHGHGGGHECGHGHSHAASSEPAPPASAAGEDSGAGGGGDSKDSAERAGEVLGPGEVGDGTLSMADLHNDLKRVRVDGR